MYYHADRDCANEQNGAKIDQKNGHQQTCLARKIAQKAKDPGAVFLFPDFAPKYTAGIAIDIMIAKRSIVPPLSRVVVAESAGRYIS